MNTLATTEQGLEALRKSGGSLKNNGLLVPFRCGACGQNRQKEEFAGSLWAAKCFIPVCNTCYAREFPPQEDE